MFSTCFELQGCMIDKYGVETGCVISDLYILDGCSVILRFSAFLKTEGQLRT